MAFLFFDDMVDIYESSKLVVAVFPFWTGVFESVDVVVGRFDCVDSTVGENFWHALGTRD